MRFSGRNLGKFDTGFEYSAINKGIQAELTNTIGTTCLWWSFDAQASTFDDLYDEGAIGGPTTGRKWKDPVVLQVFSAIWRHGVILQNERGFYNTDTLHLSFNRVATEERLPNLFSTPDERSMDRVVYQGQVYQPVALQPRGLINDDYVVAGVDLQQVMPDQMVNDYQFQAFI